MPFSRTQLQARTFIGTPNYIAPEQLRSEAYDAQTDVWSLGCLLYELCTGRMAFPARVPAVFEQIRVGYVPPLDAARFSPELRSLLAAMLHMDPRKRPTTEQILASPLVAGRP